LPFGVASNRWQLTPHLGDLRLQQVADDMWWLMLALDAGGHGLVPAGVGPQNSGGGAAHSIELEAAHQVEVEPVVRHRSENRWRGGAFHVGWSS
jgi:hypothetical protein